MAKILVVDDEPGIRRLLSSLLEDEGYEVVVAGDGHKALDMVDTEQPDVLIADMMLPGLDGRQIVQRLEEHPGRHSMPVIMMSAAFRVARLDDVPGVAAVMPKPFEVDQLLSTVERLLGRREGHGTAVR